MGAGPCRAGPNRAVLRQAVLRPNGSVRSPVAGASSAHGDQWKLRVVGSPADLGHQPGDHSADARDLRLGGAGALRAPRPGRQAMNETSWTVRLRTRIATLVPPGQALPGPPAGLRRLLDLRLRGADPRRPRGRARSRAACWPSAGPPGGTPRRSATSSTRCTCGASSSSSPSWSIHLWGKFLMAAWRGRRALTWITGVGRVRRLDRHRVHRLPVPDQLRLPVDQHPGQGRPQRGRHRRVLQRPQPRPDAAVARRRCCRSSSACSSCCTSSWSAATASCRRSASRRPSPSTSPKPIGR